MALLGEMGAGDRSILVWTQSLQHPAYEAFKRRLEILMHIRKPHHHLVQFTMYHNDPESISTLVFKVCLQQMDPLLGVEKSCLFPLTRPTIVFHADPKVFSAQFQKKILIKPNFEIFSNLLQFCWQLIKIMVFNMLF